MKTKILISACLCGKNTKYNGKNNEIKEISKLKEVFDFVLICPEVMGGLSIPRNPSEIQKDKIISNQGKDVTKEYVLGAKRALQIACKNKIKFALLKEASPSCGSSLVYDGTFSNKKISGEGITTKRLREQGVMVFNETQIDELLDMVKL